MGGEVEDAHVRIAHHRTENVSDARARKMGGASRTGALEIARTDRDDIEAMPRIGFEMRPTNAACADERDRLVVVARHRRTIGKVRRFYLGNGLGHQSIVVGRRSVGFPGFGLGHGRRASVRRSRAESAAVSTIRWAVRHSAGSRGPSNGGPCSLQWSTYSTGLRNGALSS